jgi:hypothetical protein
MVENPDVDQGQRLFEALREQFIGTARFRYSRWVLGCIRVCQHDWLRQERDLD